MDVNTSTHIVVGADNAGTRLYYTGRAGADFVSTDRAEALQAFSEEGARRTAERMNRFTGLHGITFQAELAA